MIEPVKLQLRLPIYPLPHLAGVPAKIAAAELQARTATAKDDR